MTRTNDTAARERMAALDARFDTLWRARDQLSEAQWSELYSVVQHVLRHSRFGILTALPLERDDYINSFFTDKVFLTTHGSTEDDPSMHTGGLRTMFKNYLIDLNRRDTSGANRFIEYEHEHAATMAGEDAPAGWLESLAVQIDDADIVTELFEHGLTPEQVTRSANAWLERQDRIARIYVGLHLCPDQAEALPLSTLASRYDIPSYHARARKLGITRTKQEITADGYERTSLGQWLAGELNIRLLPAHGPALHIALKILCLVALSEVCSEEFC